MKRHDVHQVIYIQHPIIKYICDLRNMVNINLNPCRRGATILPDQLNNLLQNEVSLWGPEPGHKRLHDKAANITMNPVPAARADMPIHSRLHVVG